MPIFAFRRENKKERKYNFNAPEPVIVDDEEEKKQDSDSIEFDSIVFKIWIWIIAIVVIVMFLRWIFSKVKSKQVDEWFTYQICHERGDIKYYDREADLVLIYPWYKYCDTYDTSKMWKGNGHWSCVDTWCTRPIDMQQQDEEFYALVWTRYFIRY